MKRSSGKRVLQYVGLPSVVAVALLASGVGVAGATTTSSRHVTFVAPGPRDASTGTPPPMPPGGPRGVGGAVKVGKWVGAQGTIGSSPKTGQPATVGIVPPALGVVPPSSDGPAPTSGLVGGGPFARGPPPHSV
jgi:hypothetical protein